MINTQTYLPKICKSDIENINTICVYFCRRNGVLVTNPPIRIHSLQPSSRPHRHNSKSQKAGHRVTYNYKKKHQIFQQPSTPQHGNIQADNPQLFQQPATPQHGNIQADNPQLFQQPATPQHGNIQTDNSQIFQQPVTPQQSTIQADNPQIFQQPATPQHGNIQGDNSQMFQTTNSSFHDNIIEQTQMSQLFPSPSQEQQNSSVQQNSQASGVLENPNGMRQNIDHDMFQQTTQQNVISQSPIKQPVQQYSSASSSHPLQQFSSGSLQTQQDGATIQQTHIQQYQEGGLQHQLQPQQFQENQQPQQFQENSQAQQFQENPQPQQFQENSQAQQYGKNPLEQQFGDNQQAQQFRENPQAQQFRENPQAQHFVETPQTQHYQENQQIQQHVFQENSLSQAQQQYTDPTVQQQFQDTTSPLSLQTHLDLQTEQVPRDVKHFPQTIHHQPQPSQSVLTQETYSPNIKQDPTFQSNSSLSLSSSDSNNSPFQTLGGVANCHPPSVQFHISDNPGPSPYQSPGKQLPVSSGMTLDTNSQIFSQRSPLISQSSQSPLQQMTSTSALSFLDTRPHPRFEASPEARQLAAQLLQNTSQSLQSSVQTSVVPSEPDKVGEFPSSAVSQPSLQMLLSGLGK